MDDSHPFDQERFALVLESLAAGLSLRSTCRIEGMPSTSTVMRWLAEKEPEEETKRRREQYALARETGTDAMFEELVELADEAHQVVEGDTSDSSRVSARKLQVDTRKWALSKMAPRKYGEKIDLTSDGRPLQQITGMVVRDDTKDAD